MQEKHLFEFAVIRLVPQVDREEFINVGVVLMCKRQRILLMDYHVDESRVRCFSSEVCLETIRTNLEAFHAICRGGKEGGRIGQEDVPERFRWLTAVRSSCIQTSRPHPGKTTDLQKELGRLMQEYVR